MSGRWVHERALEAVRQVREAVGDDIPIIGMGGVSDAQGIAAMIESGADVVGDRFCLRQGPSERLGELPFGDGR